jgi:2',3'-cyclic-nucleotide 2'-phosphodiesterase (5'-nucleotidase family)
MAGDMDSEVDAIIQSYAQDPDYLELVNTVIGYTDIDLVRNYNGDGTMGAFVQDAVLNDLLADDDPVNDADMIFNNPGGIRVDITRPVGYTDPYTLTYGMLYDVLPFGNQTIVGDMKGAHIIELLNQAATLFRGALQPAGVRYSFYRYGDASTYWAWGAFDIEVYDRETEVWEPIDPERVYRVATNEFLAPAGQDGFVPFKYMTNISYHGDMLNGLIRWVEANYTYENPYYAELDGRIIRYGDNTGGPVIPVTLLHNNDSHGYLDNYAKLATFIQQRRAFNPNRTLLLNAGDQIQGDSMMYYFKSAALGYAADGTPLVGNLAVNPMMAVMNYLDYDAMVVGNHEYNFGSDVFKSTLAQADFAVLQANVEDTGAYGLGAVPVEPYKLFDLDGIEVAVLGIGNHRVPSYELPSNIPGLSFSNPITTAQAYAGGLKTQNDLVIALTHIGFTSDPSSVEVDSNVDTVLAAQTPGVDVIIGGHSHTNPKTGFGAYKWLPTFVGGPDGNPVMISQANRRNLFLGEMVVGFLPVEGGGYRMAGQSGRFHEVVSATPAHAGLTAVIQPYKDLLAAYNNTVIGSTSVPIDTLKAYTEETNGANLQADASVYELDRNGISVDFHLSGAMTNAKVAADATPETPVTLKVSDMFSLMPYENSLLVLELNGPQLKRILERAYRNYYYYKYVEKFGGYSYYTTCMLDINAGGQIKYHDAYPSLPNGNNVLSLMYGDNVWVDFEDADTYYRVSTVNYLAAGACNFSDAGETLWPLDQITDDTQFYVRDAVINYISAQTDVIAPAVEGRLAFLNFTLTADAAAKTGQPGDVVDYVLTLTNTGQQADSYTVSYDSEWDMDGQTSFGPLEPGQVVTFTVSVTIPNTAQAGDDDVLTVTAASVEVPALTKSVELTTTYPAVYAFDLADVSGPATVQPGGTAVYSFTIVNEGNLSDTYTIALSGTEWAQLVGPANVTVAAGASATVVVNVVVPANAAAGDYAANVTITSQGDTNVSKALVFTTTVELEPEPDIYTLFLPLIFQGQVPGK